MAYTEAETPAAFPAASLLRTTNPRFSGGMVMEMIAGPMGSICSGNKTYYNDGNADFTHSDGIDSHIVIKYNESDYPGAPPERLFCAHRHAQDELFFRLGSTVPFPINGGLAF